MKVLIAILGLCLGWPPCAANAQQPLKCEIGPLHRSFGGTPWLVYGCDDGKSLVVVTEAGNIAGPFIFVLAWRKGKYRISGEGSGDVDASNAAGHDLEALTTDQITALFTEAKAEPPSRQLN